MNDDAGTGPRAGGGSPARTSVRPARGRPLRGVVGMALGLLVVAAAAGAAWRYGDPTTPAPPQAGEMTESPRHTTPSALFPQTPDAVDPPAQVTVDRTPPFATGSPIARESGPPQARRAARATSAPAAEAASATAAGEIPLAHLRILANPMAHVEIDGKPRGPAPIADIALPPGTHFVRLDCAALGEAVAQNVPVGPGENVTISGDFTGAHGRILVRRTAASP